MGQIEIYDLLKNLRLTGDDRFFRATEIRKLMKDAGFSGGANVYLQVAQLEAFGYLEVKREKRKRCSDHWRLFRVKSEFLEEKKKG